ncbi:hypothetical protein [Pseudalkalibacillus berkeleyi]|uniref:Lipoprotein n=1 Tax=Pseudalkalibacillus berkeleyi TaxID=1069813 RepID=A0ABS9H3W8_9BACL|nr:hypothetical protein [Pseudalkalibacillus berkeleyi]MCF6139648.1 hypothetical protein [Pseudalkalibacillus berkeleyi]
MKKLSLLFAVTFFLILTACSSNSATEQAEEDLPKTEESTEDENQENLLEDEQNDTDTGEESVDTTDESSDTEEDTTSDENAQEDKKASAITIELAPSQESFNINGISMGDTSDQVIEVLGSPKEKPHGDERYDYTFQDATYGEKLMVVFDDVGVNFIQADTSTKQGKLLTDEFIESFPGDIYKATEDQLQLFDANSLFAYVINEDSIMVVENYNSDNGMARAYMITHIGGWAYARGWSMETFKDDTQFIKVDATTAISEQ